MNVYVQNKKENESLKIAERMLMEKTRELMERLTTKKKK